MSTCLRLFLRQRLQDQTDKTLYFFFSGGGGGINFFFCCFAVLAKILGGGGNIRGGKKLIRLVYDFKMKCGGIFFRSKKWLSLPPKVTKFGRANNFIVWLLLYLHLVWTLKIFLVTQKHIFFGDNVFFVWETKYDKKIRIWKFKNPPNGQISKKAEIWPFCIWGIWKFKNPIFFVIFGFPSNKKICSVKKTYFCITRNFFRLIV